MTQTYKVQVSMNQAHIVESGFVWKQGDFGFNIEIEVLDFDTTGATPQIIFRKSTGAVEATEISVAGNKFTYAIRGTELDTPGPCVCDLKLNDSTTKRVSTASFKYFVIPDTMDGLNQHASSYSDTIEQIWETLQDYSEDSEAWAKGTKNGTAVPSTDPQYHNNAKYYSDKCEEATGELSNEVAALSEEVGLLDDTVDGFKEAISDSNNNIILSQDIVDETQYNLEKIKTVAKYEFDSYEKSLSTSYRFNSGSVGFNVLLDTIDGALINSTIYANYQAKKIVLKNGDTSATLTITPSIRFEDANGTNLGSSNMSLYPSKSKIVKPNGTVRAKIQVWVSGTLSSNTTAEISVDRVHIFYGSEILNDQIVIPQSDKADADILEEVGYNLEKIKNVAKYEFDSYEKSLSTSYRFSSGSVGFNVLLDTIDGALINDNIYINYIKKSILLKDGDTAASLSITPGIRFEDNTGRNLGSFDMSLYPGKSKIVKPAGTTRAKLQVWVSGTLSSNTTAEISVDRVHIFYGSEILNDQIVIPQSDKADADILEEVGYNLEKIKDIASYEDEYYEKTSIASGSLNSGTIGQNITLDIIDAAALPDIMRMVYKEKSIEILSGDTSATLSITPGFRFEDSSGTNLSNGDIPTVSTSRITKPSGTVRLKIQAYISGTLSSKSNYRIKVSRVHIYYGDYILKENVKIRALDRLKDFAYENANELDYLKTRITSLEGHTVPDYYLSHIEDKVDTINELYSDLEAGDQFIFISDLHADNNRLISKSLVDYVLKNTNIKTVINGGDAFTSGGGQEVMTEKECLDMLRKITSYYSEGAYYYFILGNHDTGIDYNHTDPIITPTQLYNNCGLRHNNDKVVFSSTTKMCYYWDDTVNKIRYIVGTWYMNTYVSQTWTNSWLWLADSLDSMPGDYIAIVFNHLVIKDDSTTSDSTLKDYYDIIDAYNGRTVAQYGDNVSTAHDFSGKTGKVACVIGGHTHKDGLYETAGGTPVIVVTTDNASRNVSTDTRTIGTVTECAFDVVTIDVTNKTVYMTRIGGGVGDRSVTWD